jgi:peptidoglycan/LPS O-acetylase OafA/YrhL
MTSSPRLSHRPELDGLRGLSVMAVMAFHYGLPLPGGFLGVDVFFVLSGFLITSILLDARSLRGFYVRRAVRLIPALALMLGLMWITIPIAQVVVGTAYVDSVSPAQILASATYTENLSQAFDWLPISPPLGHTWSLAAEWQFYLIWPAALLVALRYLSSATVGRVALLLAFASAVWRAVVWNGDWLRVWAGPDTHADAILLGCALALGVALPFPRWGLAIALIPLSFGGFATGGILIAALAAVSIVQRPPAFLSWRPLGALGTISYGVYLWHVPILQVVAHFLALSGWPIAAGVTIVIAALSYRYLEAPLLKRERRPALTTLVPARDLETTS